jgi:hypothetical protein
MFQILFLQISYLYSLPMDFQIIKMQRRILSKRKTLAFSVLGSNVTQEESWEMGVVIYSGSMQCKREVG